MLDVPIEIFQYGTTFALAVITIYLLVKNRSNNNPVVAVNKQLEVISGNHLSHIQDSMNSMVIKQDQVIRQGEQFLQQQQQMIMVLGEIKGQLKR